MKVLYALVCDHAHLRSDGRVDVHGVLHELYAPGFPAQHRLTLVVVVEWSAKERGVIDFTLELLDPARSPVITITGQTEVSEESAQLRPARTPFVLPLDDVRFPTPGFYAVELEALGKRQGVTGLTLVKHAGPE
jgi:hypothetical protein